MPIRPENRARYPKTWKSEIVPRIRARSGNRCECTGQCGRRHKGGMDDGYDRCKALNGMPIDAIEGPKIVLTVAHLNHTPEDCADSNLLHMCQGCHNRYDAPTRRAGIQAKAKAGNALGDLIRVYSHPVMRPSMERYPPMNYGICCGGPYNAKHLADVRPVFTVAIERGPPRRAIPAQQASTLARPCRFGDYLFDAAGRTWVWDDSSLRDTLETPQSCA